jgi:GTP-binding protein
VKSRSFIDTVVLHAYAGNGGNGSASFRREKFVPRGGPDGGDGGHGGSVILRADKDVTSLISIFFSPHQRAEHAGSGHGKQQYGRNGKDCIVKVPCGTEVRDLETGELLEDIVEHGSEFVAAAGGKGGLGNCHWKSSTNQAPLEYTEGKKGETEDFRLILKLIADIGLVGFPNAGKSSLLRKLSDAHPKVASYPFTTLNPIVGTMKFEDFSSLTVADIPGLIKGAHEGIGLGHAFLRHIERAFALTFVIDMAGVDGRAPWVDFANLREELILHDQSLADRPFIVLANKMDLEAARENIAQFKEETGTQPLEISAETGEGLDPLRRAIYKLGSPLRKPATPWTPELPSR